MIATLKTLLPLSVLALAVAMISGCCCGGGGSSDIDWGDLNTATTDDPGTFAKSCDDRTAMSTCSEYTDNAMSLLGEDFYKGMCELTNGKWTTERCPADGMAGKCDDGMGTVTFYYTSGDSAYTADTAKSACTDMMGTFSQ